ncbi:hypothetical protein DTO271G3_7247 [Paecilomyces variotii]|nr:hypothetical protein DTO271G3_7247 [Paecilomyces variotii]
MSYKTNYEPYRSASRRKGIPTSQSLHPLSALYPHVESLRPSQLHEVIPEWYMEENPEAAADSYWARVVGYTSAEPASPAASLFSQHSINSSASRQSRNRMRAMSKMRKTLRSAGSTASLRSTSSRSTHRSQGLLSPY